MHGIPPGGSAGRSKIPGHSTHSPKQSPAFMYSILLIWFEPKHCYSHDHRVLRILRRKTLPLPEDWKRPSAPLLEDPHLIRSYDTGGRRCLLPEVRTAYRGGGDAVDQYARRVIYGEGVGAEEVRGYRVPNGMMNSYKLSSSAGDTQNIRNCMHTLFRNRDFTLQNVPYNYPVHLKICMN